MSNFTPQEKFGALFRNTKKTEDKQPDYRGNFMLGGNLYTIVGWVKEGKNGKFVSLKVESTELNAKAPSSPTNEDNTDDLPF
jgi:uncharacterized protein (DUF736 family)